MGINPSEMPILNSRRQNLDLTCQHVFFLIGGICGWEIWFFSHVDGHKLNPILSIGI
jgi:hypothetical protein